MDGTDFWFDGTDHDSALTIARHGINLGYGEAGNDFSHKNGFYTTTYFEYAMDWSNKLWRTSKAVIIFKVQNKEIFKRKNKQFENDSKEWKEAISFFRHGQDIVEANRERQKINRQR